MIRHCQNLDFDIKLIMENISYELYAYEEVDEKNLS